MRRTLPSKKCGKHAITRRVRHTDYWELVADCKHVFFVFFRNSGAVLLLNMYEQCTQWFRNPCGDAEVTSSQKESVFPVFFVVRQTGTNEI